MATKFSPEEKKIITEKLLTQGYQLLSKHGMKKLKISDIAKSVDIGTGTFYLFFSSKYEFIYQVILRRKQQSAIRLHELAQAYPDGIPFHEAKQFFIDNIREENVYRLLSQEDYETLMKKLGPQRESEGNAMDMAAFIMSKLKTDKGEDAFTLFSEMYKVIVIGTSDMSKLNLEVFDDLLEYMVDSACRVLY